MADSYCITELKETIEKMNAELIQSHTKISELNAKVREQEEGLSAAQKEMSNLREENAQLARGLKESEEKCRAVQEKLELAEQKLAFTKTRCHCRGIFSTGAGTMADSCGIAELKETIEKMNAELIQSHTKISELKAKVKEQDVKVKEQEKGLSAAQKEMSNLREVNAQLARGLKESEEKCRAVQEKLELAEQKLAQFSQKPDTTAEECLAQVNETTDDAFDINSLSNEIILKIFSYLTQNQLGQIARVCRRWNLLIKSPVLWRKVNVKIFSSVREKNAKEPRNVAKSFITGLPSCVTFIRLDFSNRGDVDFEELCVKLHQNCPHLEELILIGLKISYLLPEVLNFCTQFLQCVKKLVFYNCSFSNYSRTVELNDNSKIEVLDLSFSKLKYFRKTQFSKLLNLKELHLLCTDAIDTWFEDDASFFNQLYVLNVGYTWIISSTFLAIQRHGHKLKELYLCNSILKDNDLNFNNSLCPHLRTICLSRTCVTCEDVVSLIQSCPSLENVYVDEAVAESFASHPFVVANTCKSGIVKAIVLEHRHNVDYLHS